MSRIKSSPLAHPHQGRRATAGVIMDTFASVITSYFSLYECSTLFHFDFILDNLIFFPKYFFPYFYVNNLPYYFVTFGLFSFLC